ncbi:hypothetical protein CHCC20375_4265 [Bacillus licheniformis]|nr:hypothetical protein CHCC20375_4265 [Bacillus licheniformis]
MFQSTSEMFTFYRMPVSARFIKKEPQCGPEKILLKNEQNPRCD